MNERANDGGMPVAEVLDVLGLPPSPTASSGGAVYRCPAAALSGEWVGAFAQSFGGPLVRSACEVRFVGGEGRAWDRYGESTLRVVLHDGRHVEMVKTYIVSKQTFRYRGELRETSLIGAWDAPAAASLRGVFALHRATELPRAERERLSREARTARPSPPIPWLPWGIASALLAVTVALYVGTGSPFSALGFFALAVFAQVVFHHALFSEHTRLVGVVVDAIERRIGRALARVDAELPSSPRVALEARHDAEEAVEGRHVAEEDLAVAEEEDLAVAEEEDLAVAEEDVRPRRERRMRA